MIFDIIIKAVSNFFGFIIKIINFFLGKIDFIIKLIQEDNKNIARRKSFIQKEKRKIKICNEL